MLLGSTKTQVDALLGKPVMARNVLGQNIQGEKAYSYPLPAYDVIVGFFENTARYMAVVKRRGPLSTFTPAEIASILSLNAPSSLWTMELHERPVATGIKKNKPLRKISGMTSYFTYVEKDTKQKDKVVREIHGWQSTGKPYGFFYLPVDAEQRPLLISEWQVDAVLL